MRRPSIAIALAASLSATCVLAQDLPTNLDLHAALHLRLDQEAAWRAYDAATATTPQDEEHAHEVARSLRALQTPERLDLMLRRMDEERAALSRQAVAIKRLYTELSADQRRIFDALTLPSGP